MLLRWLIPLTTGLCFGLLAVTVLRAFAAGAESYSGAYSEKTARQFEDLFLFIPPRRIAEIGWAAASAMTLLTFLASGGLSGSVSGILLRLAVCVLLAGAPMLLAPGYLLKYLRVRRRERLNVQLVDALSSMGNALKSGFSILQAFEHVVENGENPIAQEFDTFLHQTRVGVGFSEALRNLDNRVGSDDLTLVVLAIETARRTGGNLADIFEKISHTIRERLRIQGRIDTLTAQGRLQGIVVGLMPIGLGVILYFLQPGMFRPFLQSLVGVGVIAFIALLLLCGALSIRKIIRIDI